MEDYDLVECENERKVCIAITNLCFVNIVRGVNVIVNLQR